MAKAAREMGYDYLAISDHSRRVRVANGLTGGAFSEHLDALEALEERLEGIRIC
ncbi:MAG: hypothetical protein U5L11_14160 [Arhodomonas sp.]|nr:hypothetical protein [Arhodomonas sp.]